MVMKLLKLVLIWLSTAFMTPSQAQEVWDWEKCLQHAMSHNIQLRLDEINIELNALQLKQNRLNLTPSVGVESGYTYAIGRTVDMSTYEYVTKPVNTGNLQIALSQPVFEGLKNLNAVKKAGLDLKAARLDNETLRQNIQLQVMNAYLNVLNASEQLQQAKEQLKISLAQYQNNKNLVEAGALAERILTDNEAQTAQDEYQIAELEQQLELAYLALKTVLQLEQNKPIEIAVPDIPDKLNLSEPESADKTYQYALSNRPEIESAQLKTESADLELKIARSAYMPKLSFFTGVGTNLSDQITETRSTIYTEIPIGYVKTTGESVYTMYPNPVLSTMPFGRQLTNNISYALGINLSVPIYNKRSGYLQTERARLSVLQTRLNQEDMAYKLYQDIKQAHVKALTSGKNYTAANKYYDAAKASYEFAQERLMNGAISQIELNLAQNNLFIAQSRLSQAKYEYIFNMKVLDFYSGKPIDLN